MPSLGAIEATDSILVYDEVDSEVLKCYQVSYVPGVGPTSYQQLCLLHG